MGTKWDGWMLLVGWWGHIRDCVTPRIVFPLWIAPRFRVGGWRVCGSRRETKYTQATGDTATQQMWAKCQTQFSFFFVNDKSNITENTRRANTLHWATWLNCTLCETLLPANLPFFGENWRPRRRLTLIGHRYRLGERVDGCSISLESHLVTVDCGHFFDRPANVWQCQSVWQNATHGSVRCERKTHSGRRQVCHALPKMSRSTSYAAIVVQQSVRDDPYRFCRAYQTAG